jgi:hypothetical protein
VSRCEAHALHNGREREFQAETHGGAAEVEQALEVQFRICDDLFESRPVDSSRDSGQDAGFLAIRCVCHWSTSFMCSASSDVGKFDKPGFIAVKPASKGRRVGQTKDAHHAAAPREQSFDDEAFATVSDQDQLGI